MGVASFSQERVSLSRLGSYSIIAGTASVPLRARLSDEVNRVNILSRIVKSYKLDLQIARSYVSHD